MTLFPKKFSNPKGGVYHLNDNFLQAADGSFRGTGTDGSELGYSLFIASAATERVVSFKAFIESYKYNLQKSTEENKNSLRTKVYYTDKSSNLSISLSLNIPAHSVNESVNNVAKIEELQKLIVAGNWSYGVNISSKTNSTVPVMLVHFRNLITNSRKVSDLSITSFDDMLAKGFTCYLKDVSYSPDTSAGFFEFDSFLYPKNLKLNLEIIYESETLLSPFDGILDRCSINGFSTDGEYASMKDPFAGPTQDGTTASNIKNIDDGASPFHSYDYKKKGGKKESMTIADMNNFDLPSSAGFSTIQKKSDSFLFIGLPSSNEGDKSLEASFSDGFHGNVLKNGKIMRHVFLESFLESHERKLTPEYQNSDSTANSSVHNILTGQVQNELSYSFKLNMVADSLIQAKQNCAKIQYMCRMFVKRYVKTPSANPTTGTFDFADVSNLCKVYSPSFVESAGSPKGGTRDVKKIFEEYSIDLYWSAFSFDVQMDAGFFDDDGFIYPKVISLDLSFKTHEKYVAGYNYTTKDEKNPKWQLSVQSRNSARHARNSFLFPYNRKTVKI